MCLKSTAHGAGSTSHATDVHLSSAETLFLPFLAVSTEKAVILYDSYTCLFSFIYLQFHKIHGGVASDIEEVSYTIQYNV